MKIVFTSNLYLPIMGGSVMVLDRWARALVEMGHDVSILTKTTDKSAKGSKEWSLGDAKAPRVCRLPKSCECLKVLRTADRVVMIEMSLYWLSLIFAAGKLPLVTHHNHAIPPGKKMRLYRWLQISAGYLIPSVACSRMIAKQWGFHVGVVPNPYDERIFKQMSLDRDVDFMFAGRFGPEKGVKVFTEAIRCLSQDFIEKHQRLPRVVAAGKGPDKDLITALHNATPPVCEVIFCGESSPEELSCWYNRAKVVVIPSTWQEPFGLIGIEAMACGCKIVCSDQAGLREATAGLAQYCATGDHAAFSAAMMLAVSAPQSEAPDAAINSHLARHTLRQSAECLLTCGKNYNNRNTIIDASTIK